jgi:hypothetical protein
MRPVALQPGVDLLQRRGVDRVQAASAVGPHGREAVLAQHPQVQRHRRLGDRELRPHHGGDLAGRALPVGEQLKDPASHRVAQDVERTLN